MSKTNEELEGIYKTGLPVNHIQGLREVYQSGRQDEAKALESHHQALQERIKTHESRASDQDQRIAEAEKRLAAQHAESVKAGHEQTQHDGQAKARENFALQPDPAAAQIPQPLHTPPGQEQTAGHEVGKPASEATLDPPNPPL